VQIASSPKDTCIEKDGHPGALPARRIILLVIISISEMYVANVRNKLHDSVEIVRRK
jgi:hypothetical protein